MISSKRIHSQYNDLYIALRHYVWPFEIIKYIAELEDEVYKSFPSQENIRNIFTKLKTATFQDRKDSKPLDKAFNNFESAIVDLNDELYSDIHYCREGVL